jgi:hypothetical protein
MCSIILALHVFYCARPRGDTLKPGADNQMDTV